MRGCNFAFPALARPKIKFGPPSIDNETYSLGLADPPLSAIIEVIDERTRSK